MAVDADDVLLPLDDDAVNHPASAGAAEFRALKTKLNNAFLLDGVEADAPFLITMNGKAWFSEVIGTPDDPVAMYGHFSRITRTGGNEGTIGGQFEALLADGVTGTEGVFGIVVAALHGETGASGPLRGAFLQVFGRDHNNSSTLYGAHIFFSNRTGATPTSGLGNNKYNNLATAIFISSDNRSVAGEYCGWNNGIVFDEYAIDLKVGGVKGYGIDFYASHYLAGGTPSTDYRYDAAIRLRTGDTIVWYDGVVKSRIGYDYHTGAYAGFWRNDTMYFGVSMADGHINVRALAGGGDRAVRVDNDGHLYAV